MGGGDFNTTRYICLDCMTFDEETGAESNTLDLCVACMSKSRERDELKHIPTHALLQSREAEQMKIQYTQHKAARNLLQDWRNEGTRSTPALLFVLTFSKRQPRGSPVLHGLSGKDGIVILDMYGLLTAKYVHQ